MHELGIVFHMIDTLQEVGAENGLTSIARVTLDLGEVTGVLPDYLLDCWRWAADRTELLRGADSSIRDLPPFPAPLLLRPCKGCLREAMLGVAQTMRNGRIVPFDEAGQADFRQDGENLRPEEALVPSNRVIRKMIAETGRDYRSETAGRPAEPLKPVGIKAVSGRWLD